MTALRKTVPPFFLFIENDRVSFPIADKKDEVQIIVEAILIQVDL